MSSILTNNGAMVALQTLKSINSDLSTTQSQISTGKSVASAKDNASVWAISKVMESDVKGFQAISDSLALGQSSVAVAANAAETVTDLLTDIKGKIVAAQEENVDREKIQTDITALTEQIDSVVKAAQFNGLNLIDGSSEDVMKVLSSLDRSASGEVKGSHIEVGRKNLSVSTPTTSASFGGGNPADQAAADDMIQAGGDNTDFAATTYDGSNETSTITGSGGTLTFTIGEVQDGSSYRVILDDVNVNVAGGGTTTGARTFEYVASATDGTADVAKNLMNQINAFFGAATNATDGYEVAQGTGTNANQLTVTNGSATDIKVFTQAATGGTAGSSASSGGLGALSNIDVTSDSGATGALAAIDGLISQSIDAAAAFGSAQSRMETQTSFVANLTDSLKSGIGAMVDADMEEASARLQALQVQQQLGVQSLSIANQAPQSILSLFR
ncbi:flagellin [Thalassospira alkalitolerans]|uniref:flagellin N-terminal helical domain-containing protein n=2 Tax=Alphaproteobacteria TaxID=28211 RepID=UPI003AA7CF21